MTRMTRSPRDEEPVRTVAMLLSLAVFLVPLGFVAVTPHALDQSVGVDFMLYRDAAARWLAGGSFYEPYQLAGPYQITAGDVLYPPVALLLFVPFAIVPPVLWWTWWAIPLAVTAWAIGRLRPAPVAWPLMALCIAWPTTILKIWTGNPVIWSMAALSIGVVHAWPAVLVAVKPSLAPFMLFGARRRSWWLALAACVAVCLPFGALWADWVASIVDSRGGGILYSALETPMLLLPLVAWIWRVREPVAGLGGRAPVPIATELSE